MAPTLGFLHVADVQADYFERLVGEIAPGTKTQHLIDESLLRMAREHGTDDPNVIAEVQSAMESLFGPMGCPLAVCTCSTIGGIAETMPVEPGRIAMRIDRAVADRMTSRDGRILAVAALESTLEPTRALLLDSARRQGTIVDVALLVSEDAWPHFEAGRQDAYLDAIANTVNGNASGYDFVFLAQASMADAAERCTVSVPVLSAPRLGVEAAIARMAI